MFLSYFTVEGEAVCSTIDSELGKCWVNFSSRETDTTKLANYNILETDYTNYSFVYTCEDTYWGKDEDGYILLRDWNVTSAQMDAYEAKFKAMVPNWGGNLIRHKQGTNRSPACEYLPLEYAANNMLI